LSLPRLSRRKGRSRALNHTPLGIHGARCRFHKAWMTRPCRPGYVAGTSTSYRRAARPGLPRFM
jgi:hypothetical protein